MLMVSASRSAKKISKHRNRLRRIKWKSAKIGRQKKYGEIISVSLALTPAIIDLTWAPDSLHFVTCGTDSKICVLNINEG